MPDLTVVSGLIIFTLSVQLLGERLKRGIRK